MEIVEVRQFRDKYLGSKCFMIGNGPSLTYEILDQIRGYPSFAMNNISLAYPHTKWRPTYYISVARSPVRNQYWIKRARESVNTAGCSFIWAKTFGSIVADVGQHAKVSILSCSNQPYWSSNADECVSRFGSSMFSALQLAIYMGYSPYLLGCDMGFVGSINFDTGEDSAHFDPDYLGDMKIQSLVDNSHHLVHDEICCYISHQIAAIRSRERGIDIKTCLDNKLAKVYSYIPLEEALNEDVSVD